jgi:hypothetical protein
LLINLIRGGALTATNLEAQKDLKKVVFFGDETEGEYGFWSLWESKEDAEAEAEAIRLQLKEAVSGIAKQPPTRRLFEVYEPKA